MPKQLQKKVALITGGTSRIGQSIAMKLGSAGARLALTYHSSRQHAEEAVKEIESAGISAKLYSYDLAKPGSASKLIEQVIREFGLLDILINNASVFTETPLGNINETDWDQILNTNARGPFFLIQAASEALKKTGGAIVNISDLYGNQPLLRDRIPYCVSKAALNAITKGLALALAPQIRVNAVAPGAITFPENYTDDKKGGLLKEIPLGRPGNATDIAEAVAFLLMDAPYVTGQILAVDGGRSMKNQERETFWTAPEQTSAQSPKRLTGSSANAFDAKCS